MKNDVITSILARCLSDAGFLDDVVRDPVAALRAYRLRADEIDEFGRANLARLADLRGFIAKVKHNDLWEDFPYTRLLLRRFGFELAVFRAYSALPGRVRRRPGEGRRRRIARFLDFLENHLQALTDSKSALLRAVLVHERIRWEFTGELKQSERPQDVARPPGSWTDESARPILSGAVRLVELEYNPIEVVPLIPGGALDVESLHRRRRWLAYASQPEAGQLQVFELPPAAALLLSLTDGRRSLRSICKKARETLGPFPVSEAFSFFRQADENGLVRELRRPTAESS